MTALEWTGWIGAALAWLAGGVFLWRAFVSRSLRRHCPKCDYIMLESSGLRCPECGHTAQNARSFHHGRFRRRRVILALSLMILGVILQAAPRIKQNGWIHSMPTTALILYADWGNSEAAFGEIRKRAFDDAVPYGVIPGRWQSDVLYGWQRMLLTKSCMNALQSHRPRSLRLATFELLRCRLTSANGDYTELVSCLTDTDPVIQEQAFYILPDVCHIVNEGVNRRIDEQLLSIIKQIKDPVALSYATLYLDDNDAIRPELNAWLNHDDPMFRMLACHALHNEDESSAYIPVLIELVTNTPDAVWPITGYSFREEGGMLLAYSHLDSPGALAELLKAIDHPDENIQAWAILKIGKMGELAIPALDSLIVKLDHPSRSIRGYSISAIGAIGKQARRAVPDLLRFVDGEMYGLGGSALKAAIQIDPEPDRFTPLVFDMLQEAAPYNRAHLYRAMRWLDLTDERIVGTLRKGLEDMDADARTAAAETLGFISPTSEDIISTLLTGLDDPYEKVRLASVAALVKHPMYAEKTVPLLRGMLANDDEEKVRAAVAKTLGSIAGDQDTIETLINAIQDDDPYVRRAAIDALGTIGPMAATAIAPLRSLLNQARPDAWTFDKANAALDQIERRD